MTKKLHWIGGPALMAVLLLPPVALAEHDEEQSQEGGEAAEHRSEQADENSNAQWQDGATKGQDRAEEMRGKKGKKSKGKSEKGKSKRDHDDDDEADDDSAKSDKAAVKGGKEKSGKAEKGSDKEPKGNAKGFWSRLFSGDDEGEPDGD